MKTAADVTTIVDEYDKKIVIERDAKQELESVLKTPLKAPTVNTEEIINSDATVQVEGKRLSLTQWCEHVESQRVFSQLSHTGKRHVKGHSGPDNQWVRLAPLAHLDYNMKARNWVCATRRRLNMPVSRVKHRRHFV